MKFMLALLAAALLSIGSFEIVWADECPWDISMITYIEGPLAQDTDMDGDATILEGSFDIDSDGWFTQVEADFLGLCDWINWKPCTDECTYSQITPAVCSVKLRSCRPVQNAYACRTPVNGGACWTVWLGP